MGHENPRISSGQKEREIGLTSCSDEWVVPKSPLLLSGKSEMITQLRQKKSCLALGENDPQPIEDNCEFSLISVQLDFFIFFHLFLPATCGGGSGGAMDEEIEREKGRFFFFFFENKKNAGLERERERLMETNDLNQT